MNFYLYRSATKIEMLYSQIRHPTKTKITWGLTTPYVNVKRESESDDATLENKLQAVLQELDSDQQIGAANEGKPYIRATLPMKWGLYEDTGFRDPLTGPPVYFGSTSDDLLFGMAGSSVHIDGMYGLNSTSSRSTTPAVINFLLQGLNNSEHPPGDDHLWESPGLEIAFEGVALANHYLREPVQNLEFVAKVIARAEQCRLRPWQDARGFGILATPLYVSQTEFMMVDDDNLWPPRSAATE